MITILELLAILETEFSELSWTICPNLEMGILSANTFEISKKPAKIYTLLQKLESHNLQDLLTNSIQNDKKEDQNGTNLTDLQKLENLESEKMKNGETENGENLDLQAKPTNLEFSSKNPMEIAVFLSPQIQNYLTKLGIKTQINPTGAYINLDLDNILWQEFLTN